MIKIKIFIILCLSLFLISCTNEINFENKIQNIIYEELVIGYCPTMEPYANLLKESYGFQIKQLGFTWIVLDNLNNDEIDIALIGRKAYSYEKIDLYEKKLKEGYTLIKKGRSVTSSHVLNNFDIYTNIDLNIAKNLIPESNIIFTDEINLTTNLVYLINWDDFNDYELFIVMEEAKVSPLKDIRFRAPFLYSKNESWIKTISFI